MLEEALGQGGDSGRRGRMAPFDVGFGKASRIDVVRNNGLEDFFPFEELVGGRDAIDVLANEPEGMR